MVLLVLKALGRTAAGGDGGHHSGSPRNYCLSYMSSRHPYILSVLATGLVFLGWDLFFLGGVPEAQPVIVPETFDHLVGQRDPLASWRGHLHLFP
jgi:hypothetical protein